MSLLSATDVRKSFAGVHALRGVSLHVNAGDVHALLGENGAGKSTLIRIITGAEVPDAGTLHVEGQLVARMTPGIARELGIAAIYQQPALFPDLTVAENIALALESPRALSVVRWRERRRHAAALLEQAGADVDPDARAASLTMPQQQLVEIAKALGARARIVIMDEPTTSLTTREVERLFGVIARMREAGTAIIYISHRLEEVMTIADAVTVLRDGQTVRTLPRETTSIPELVALMVGRETSTMFPKRSVRRDDAALEVTGLTSHAAGVRDVSFVLNRGEVLGVAGLVGAGRTELAETLFGLRPVDSGQVRIGGQPRPLASPGEAVAAGLAYVPEDRRRHGVIAEMSVAANTSLAALGRVSTRTLIDRDAEDGLAGDFIRRFRIKADDASTEVGTLSGGNQQKVALARWLAVRPTVLILDEPTQGVDVGAKAEIHAMMQEFVEQGLAILMISSDLPEILAMSDRVAVMRDGTIAGILDRAEVSQERVLALALPA